MICILFFILLQGEESQSPSDTIPRDTFDVVTYDARTIVYDLETSTIILMDSSSIRYQDILLVSDSAHYYIKTNQLEAFGNCDLRQLEDSIKGSYLRYNLDTRKAMMTSGRTQIDNGFLDGKDIYWIDEKTINAYHGIYTTCSDTPPHYYFYAPKMKVYLGDMVIARPIVLFVEGFPVAAAPFWFVPIASKRKSGLLPFRAGNSRAYGKYIQGFAYYFVLNDYADMTVQLDAMEKQGFRPHFEGIWNYSPFTKGTVYGSYIRENNTGNQRYNIEARNESPYFLLGSNFNCDIKYQSDNTYRQDYTDSTMLWVEQEISSQATLSRSIFGYKNSLIYERQQNYATDEIEERLPYYSLASPSRTLFSFLNYSFSGHIVRDRKDSAAIHEEVSGANIHTSPSFQQSILGLFSISPGMQLDLATFDEDTLGNTWPIRLGYSFNFTASTNLYRLFDVHLLGIHGILHKMLPKITYTYTPNFDYGELPRVNSIPVFAKTHKVAFALDHTFESKIGKDLKKVTLTQINLGCSYDVDLDSLSVINLNWNLSYNPFPKPISAFTTQVTGTIDPYTRDHTYTISNTTGMKVPFFSISINQRYTNEHIYQVWFNGDLKPTPRWTITYGARYDWEQREFVDYAFSLRRDLHCWEALFSFNQLADDWRYDFQVRIKSIPEVTIGKGLLGYILE
ncbi:LPS-assembly protein LptD [candidate division WOR-3 bacterium]|nr:LPS-assembly protein LptD [candidate division WOR-3 bacterium]